MTEATKKFLLDIGLSETDIETLEAKEQPEDFIYDEWLEKYRLAQAAVYKKTVLAEDIENEVSSRMFNFRKTVARKLPKVLGVAATADFKTDADIDAFLTAAKAEIDEKLQAVGGSDKEKTALLQSHKEKIVELTQQLQDSKSAFESELAKVQDQMKQHERKARVDAMFESKLSAVEWGVDEAHIPVWRKNLRQEIEENYTVLEDGSLLDRDGKGKAINFTGTGIYATVDEPINHLLAKYNLVRKNNNDPKKPARVPGTVPASDDLSDHAKKLMERLHEAAAKRERRQY